MPNADDLPAVLWDIEQAWVRMAEAARGDNSQRQGEDQAGEGCTYAKYAAHLEICRDFVDLASKHLSVLNRCAEQYGCHRDVKQALGSLMEYKRVSLAQLDSELRDAAVAGFKPGHIERCAFQFQAYVHDEDVQTPPFLAHLRDWREKALADKARAPTDAGQGLARNATTSNRDSAARAKALLDIVEACREWARVLRENGWTEDGNTHAEVAQTAAAKAAEAVVMGLVKAHWPVLADCRNDLPRDPSTPLDRAFDYIGIYLGRGPEALRHNAVALPECLAVEVVKPNVAEPYREPTFIVQLERWARQLGEFAALAKAGEAGAAGMQAQAAPGDLLGNARLAKEATLPKANVKRPPGRPPKSGDMDPNADRREAKAWRKWRDANKQGNSYPSYAAYAKATGKDADAVRAAVGRDQKRLKAGK